MAPSSGGLAIFSSSGSFISPPPSSSLPRGTRSSGRLRSGAPKSIDQSIGRSTITAMEAHHASRARRTVGLLLLSLLFRPFLRQDGAQIRSLISVSEIRGSNYITCVRVCRSLRRSGRREPPRGCSTPRRPWRLTSTLMVGTSFAASLTL